MTEEYKAQRKFCDGCGKKDDDSHFSVGHLSTDWPSVRGYDLCPLCEMKLRYKLYEKANINVIEDILATIPKA